MGTGTIDRLVIHRDELEIAVFIPPVDVVLAGSGGEEQTFSDRDAAIRAGPGCLNNFSASISGASAGVRLPCGGAAG
jgi:hypothetical protein